MKVVGCDNCPEVYTEVRRGCVLTFAAQRTPTRPREVIHGQVGVWIDISGVELPGVRSHLVESRVVYIRVIIRQGPWRHEQEAENRDHRSNTTDGRSARFQLFLFYSRPDAAAPLLLEGPNFCH